MKIEIHDNANNDIIAGFHFYNAQGDGLGQYFLDSLFSDIDSLQLYAGIHPIVQGYHRMLAKRFPYSIYYKTLDGTTQVWAILDCRQNPQKIQSRLS